MRSGPLLQISVRVRPEHLECAGAILEELLASPAVAFHDLETGNGFASVYIPPHALSGQTAVAAVRRRIGVRIRSEIGTEAAVQIRRLRPQDWAESWKRHFKPIAIGSHLLVKPSWSRRRAPAGARVVILDPGLSFGTGQHPTTRFCLEQLAAARATRTRQGFLDLGTGTGILAIAAAKLGYAPVHGFDFDADAIRIARGNARRNRVAAIRLRQADLTAMPVNSRVRYDVIAANLTYDLLIAERQRILHRLRPNGRLLLAGILRKQFDQVKRAYEDAGLHCWMRKTTNEWTSGVFRFDARRSVR